MTWTSPENITVDGLQYSLNAFDVLRCINHDCLYLIPTQWDQRMFLEQAFKEKAIIPVTGSAHGCSFDGDWIATEIRFNESGTLERAVLSKYEQ